MEISASKFRQLCEHSPDQTAKAILKSMKEFGYSDLTLDEVKNAMTKAMADDDSSNVIVIWIKKYLVTGISD